MQSAKLSQVPIVMLQAGSRSATGSGSPTAAKRKAAGAAIAASASQGQPSGGQEGDAGGSGSPNKGGSAPDGLQQPQQQAAPAAGSADLMSLDTPDPQALQAAQVGALLGGLAKQRPCDISAQLSPIAGCNRGLRGWFSPQLNFCVAVGICLTVPTTPPKIASWAPQITASANMYLRPKVISPFCSLAPISSCPAVSRRRLCCLPSDPWDGSLAPPCAPVATALTFAHLFQSGVLHRCNQCASVLFCVLFLIPAPVARSGCCSRRCCIDLPPFTALLQAATLPANFPPCLLHYIPHPCSCSHCAAACL